ncbi:hypothetical protein GZ78_00040 [Endozoicomonas numazuensis]|uniref:Glutamine amidotransferase domain-containing protein n=2 Tax=Endozoicomonas numazuensis TaxID=1137799 RepID=A0A081NJF1_9GAMM|nr:hypothetical protein GZ78_00040 [Endozoicomonas numazuensis]
MDQNKIAPVIIIDCGSNKTPDIKSILSSLNTPSKIIPLKEANLFPFRSASAVIISGGPHLFTDSPAIKNELMQQFQFLQQPLPPTLGICLGHQAIALTYGGAVYRDQERRDQDSIIILESHKLFENLPVDPVFKEDHCEGIKAGDNTTVLARSEFYEVEVIMINDRPMLGVQFHPEVSGKNGKILISNFIHWALKHEGAD